MPDFSKFDLSGREPRPVQQATLKALNDAWTTSDTFALVLPVGSGKSAIGRAIQVACGADVITPSNILIDQYANEYRTVNVLKGKSHYRCRSGLDCRTWQECGQEPCEDCPYQAAKAKTIEGLPTFYNPMSMYFNFVANRIKGNKVLVVDEAHQLASMILMLTSKRLKRSEYKFNKDCVNEIYLVQWLKDQQSRLDRLASMYHKKNDVEKLAKAKDEIESLGMIRQGLEEDGQNFCMWFSKDQKDSYLNIKPLFPPRFLMNKLIGGKKLILMSGTLFDHDIRNIIGDQTYVKIEQDSPIPVENRRIVYKPAPFKINYQTDPRQLVEYIETFLPTGPENTLIHSTYSLSKKIAHLFKRKLIFNTNEDKDERLAEFKQEGGIFLGAGCAEGLDLKGDLCRVNIIPKLSFPDLNDPAVIKRRALTDGSLWYSLETLKTLIQAAGRSTRSAEDWSTIFVLDPNFKRLVQGNRQHLPKSFLESIVF